MELKMVYGFPTLLHEQHQSITMICCFLKLYKVRILPKAVDQAKKVTPYSFKYTSKGKESYHGD
jgi:hypothetical protein